MTRNRAVPLLTLLGLTGAGLTVLMAAGGPSHKPADPAQPSLPPTRLVCLGTVDKEARMIGIFPDNYPQPSQVIKVLVEEGDEVKKGQPLLELDREAYEVKIAEADAGVAAAQADLAKARALVRQHADHVKVLEQELLAKEAELAAKKKELTQIEEAVAQGNRNKVDLETPRANVTAADLTLRAARLKWEFARGESPTYLVDLATAGVIQKKELKRQAELALQKATCTAKADGRIVRTFVAAGSSFGMATQEPAFWFIKKGPLLVRAQVTQEFAGRLAEGQSATIEDETATPEDLAQNQRVWKGRVTKVVDQFLPKRNSSGGALDIFQVNDDRVLECLVSIEVAPGQAPPRFGQKVRVLIDQ